MLPHSVWTHFMILTDITKLEKVQRTAVRWISPDYSIHTNVTSLLSHLSIPTLQRRQSSKLSLFNNNIKNLLPISIPSCYQRIQSHTRNHHPAHFILPKITLNDYKYRFTQGLSDIGIIYLSVSLNQETFTYLFNQL